MDSWIFLNDMNYFSCAKQLRIKVRINATFVFANSVIGHKLGNKGNSGHSIVSKGIHIFFSYLSEIKAQPRFWKRSVFFKIVSPVDLTKLPVQMFNGSTLHWTSSCCWKGYLSPIRPNKVRLFGFGIIGTIDPLSRKCPVTVIPVSDSVNRLTMLSNKEACEQKIKPQHTFGC